MSTDASTPSGSAHEHPLETTPLARAAASASDSALTSDASPGPAPAPTERRWKWKPISSWGPGTFGFLSSMPFLLVMLFGFVAPLGCVLWFGFMPPKTFALMQMPTLANYTTIFEQTYFKSVAWSLGLAAVTVCILLVICYPLAYAMAKIFKGGATFITYAIASSLFVSENIRLFGWVIGLMKNGVVGGTLAQFGITIDSQLYNVPVILLGMAYVYLPFMLFPLVLGIRMVPDQLCEAAYDLGASRGQVFRRVTLPLSMPGVLIGSLLVFVLAAGAIAEAKILGGQKVVTIAADIESEFTYAQNWPLGSALSTLFIALTTVVVFIALGRFNLDRLLGKTSD